MSFAAPSRALSGPRRRSLIVGVAGAGPLVGCSGGGEGSDADARASAGEKARERAARDSAGLVERYDAVIGAHPDLTGLLAPLRAEVVRHVGAFGGEVGTASASPSGAPSPSASPPPVAADPKAALVELAGAERKLADERAKALLDVPGELARVMASMAAAGAGHAYVLTEGAK